MWTNTQRKKPSFSQQIHVLLRKTNIYRKLTRNKIDDKDSVLIYIKAKSMSESGQMCNDGSMRNEKKISTANLNCFQSSKSKLVNSILLFIISNDEIFFFKKKLKVDLNDREIGHKHLEILKHKKKMLEMKNELGTTHQPRNANATGRTRAWNPTPAFRLWNAA